MKSPFASLLLSLCLILPSALKADDKAVTEDDAGTVIAVNKGDTITFTLKDETPGTWTFVSTLPTFIDSTLDSKTTPLFSLDPNASYRNNTGTITIDVMNAVNSGQSILVFEKVIDDKAFPYVKALVYIINIQDPAAAPVQ